MDAPPDDLEAWITKQLPVVSPQRESLAVVMLSRWMRLAAAHGAARLEVTYHHGHERWVLRWHAPNHRRAHRLDPTTPAALLVRLLAELPEAEQRRWTCTAPTAPAEEGLVGRGPQSGGDHATDHCIPIRRDRAEQRSDETPRESQDDGEAVGCSARPSTHVLAIGSAAWTPLAFGLRGAGPGRLRPGCPDAPGTPSPAAVSTAGAAGCLERRPRLEPRPKSNHTTLAHASCADPMQARFSVKPTVPILRGLI